MKDCSKCKYGPTYDPCSDYCDEDYEGKCCFSPGVPDDRFNPKNMTSLDDLPDEPFFNEFKRQLLDGNRIIIITVKGDE